MTHLPRLRPRPRTVSILSGRGWVATREAFVQRALITSSVSILSGRGWVATGMKGVPTWVLKESQSSPGEDGLQRAGRMAWQRVSESSQSSPGADGLQGIGVPTA